MGRWVAQNSQFPWTKMASFLCLLREICCPGIGIGTGIANELSIRMDARLVPDVFDTERDSGADAESRS
jgi:hypothetical protein